MLAKPAAKSSAARSGAGSLFTQKVHYWPVSPRTTSLRFLSAGVLALLLVAWADGRSEASPPRCSPADSRKGVTLPSGKGVHDAPLYLRSCGPARAVVRLNGKTYVIRGGWCWREWVVSGDRTRRAFRGVNVGLLANRPAPPARGISFWWDKRVTRPGRVMVAESAIELPGVRLSGDGPVTIAKGLNSGTFRFVDRTSPASLSGSFSCR
jgi:hypothetical protein